ncbi:MAG: hypothetical protein JNM70_19580 [Anaerolineae bacterium]|nr:hypothetical protein [Anaerolineae bacterium]
MDIGTIVIVLVVAGVGLFWLAFPFITRAGSQAEGIFRQRDRERLLVDYERVLTTIRELDDDYRLGKLSQETYQMEREAWAEQGTILVEQLEKLKGSVPPPRPPKSKPPKGPQPDADSDLDAALEQAIAKYVKAKSGSGN